MNILRLLSLFRKTRPAPRKRTQILRMQVGCICLACDAEYRVDVVVNNPDPIDAWHTAITNERTFFCEKCLAAPKERKL